MAAKSGRAVLNRMLFMTCRSAIDARHQGDGEMVRVYRAGICLMVTAETRGEDHAVSNYKQLELDELRKAVSLAESKPEINTEAVTDLALAQPGMATPVQLARFRYSAMACAVRYANLDGLTHVEGDVEYAGERLRAFIVLRFNTNTLPKNLYGALRIRWVNPTANEYLQQGGYRGKAEDLWKFFDHQLRLDECSYLITRFREVQQNSEPVPVAMSAN